MTLKLVQLPRKKSIKTNEVPIYIRLTENRKSRYISTGISVLEKDWNEKAQQVRKGHPLAKRYNAELTDLIVKAEGQKSELRQNGSLDATQLKSRLSVNKFTPLIEYAESYRETLDKEQRYWEHRHFGVVINDIKEAKLDLVSIRQVDSNVVKQFSDFLTKEKKNSTNTVRKKLQRFRSMIKKAMNDNFIQVDPFQFHEPIKRVNSNKTKLSPKQIETIEKLELNTYTSLWHTRNYFLFSFYLAGIRFSDLCTLKPSNIIDGRLRYKMRKTGGEKNMKLFPQAIEILKYYNTTDEDKYIFPIIQEEYNDEFVLKSKISSRNVLINRLLKELAKKAGIQENISFHVSRHSFAHYALKKGMSIYSISKALAHTDLKTTQVYLKAFDEDLLDKEMDKLF